MEFLASPVRFEIKKIHISYHPVNQLRKSLRIIAYNLDYEDEQQKKLFSGIFGIISSLQLSPVIFDEKFYEIIESLFPIDSNIEAIWGNEIHENLKLAKAIAYDLMGELNPMIIRLIESAKMANNSGCKYKISASSKDAELIVHILQTEGLNFSREDIICSQAEYARSGLLDTLIRLGPLHSFGVGSAPSGILSAPRYKSIVQLLWDGTPDDPDFGDDALIRFSERTAESIRSPIIHWHLSLENILHTWSKPIHQFETKLKDIPNNDFAILRRNSSEICNGQLLIIDDIYGILYHPQSAVIIFDPRADQGDRVSYTRVADVCDGTYLCRIKEVNATGIHSNTSSTERSNLWKGLLAKQIESNIDEIVSRLEQSNVSLKCLSLVLRNWAKPPTSVIHAPARKEHFHALCYALGISSTIESHAGPVDFYTLAWNDIRMSRGEAISAGHDRSELLINHVVNSLRMSSDDISDLILGRKTNIKWPISSFDNNFELSVDMHLINSVESNVSVLSSELMKINELEYIRQWQQ